MWTECYIIESRGFFMSIFGCASDEQLIDEMCEVEHDTHYCEYHDSYYCDFIDNCNPRDQCLPAMEHCRLYRNNLYADVEK